MDQSVRTFRVSSQPAWTMASSFISAYPEYLLLAQTKGLD